MKKVLALTIGILIVSTSFAQVPFDVDKKLHVSGNDTVQVESDATNISVKMSSDTKHLKLVVENRDHGVKVKSKKMLITNYKKPGAGIGGKRIYTCKDTNLGHVEIEEELVSMTGLLKIDRDKDGVYEEIFVLK